LETEKLSKIWTLSDRDKDGNLNREEFSIAMYLVYKSLQKDPIPDVLPEGFLSSISTSRLKTGVIPPLAIATPPKGSPKASPRASLSAASGLEWSWVVSAIDRLKYDNMFKQLDTNNDGLVSGLEIRDVFLRTGLQQEILAQIWNLSDIKKTGMLNSEQFALAMYLVEQQKLKKELPLTLSPEMVPPSMRETAIAESSDVPTVGGDFAAVKEMDKINKDIENLGREKTQLQSGISNTENSIRKTKAEIEAHQRELEKANKGLSVLTSKKNDAMQKLEGLKDEVCLRIEIHLGILLFFRPFYFCRNLNFCALINDL
jgi:epidermal growth factor receptor substrate 15